MAKLVSRVYADALFLAVLEEEKLDSCMENVKELIQIFQSDEDLCRLLSEPRISKEEKEQLLNQMFGEKISKELLGTLVLLIRKGHTGEINRVLEAFLARAKEEKKIGVVTVQTAKELSDQQKERVVNKLLETTKYEALEMNYQVDESLIAGMVIQIGDRTIDSSIRTKLYRLSRELRQTQV